MKTTFKKLILDDLKAQGYADIAKKITSVKYNSFSGGDSVDVAALNLFKSERAVLEALLDQYQYGTFDAYTDCAGTKKNTHNKPRRAKYVHLRNEFSNDLREDIKELLRIDWDITDDKSAKDKRNEWYDTLIWRELNALTGGVEVKICDLW
ncbi:MAG: hypothetical protein H0X02_00785 [Nitrosomonas sp.]|nr:hypothetical protein [Nitrosomonas sp.]